MAKKREASTLEPDLSNLREVITIERETFASFCKRNGAFVQVGQHGENLRDGSFINSKLVFESGATAENDDPFGDGRFGGCDPSDMRDLERLRNMFTFLTVKLEDERTNYDRFVGEVRLQQEWHTKCPDSCPPPPSNWKEQADAGKQRMRDLSDKGREILEELKAVDPELQRKKHREEQAAQHNETARKQLAEVQSVPYSEHMPEAHIGQRDVAERVRFQ